MPYTFGYRTGGAADAMYTRLAPASRAMLMICEEVVPRTIESSTRRTLRPANSEAMGESFWRTDFLRRPCAGMMKVRPTYRFFMKPSRYGMSSACAHSRAAVRAVSGTGMTTSMSCAACSATGTAVGRRPDSGARCGGRGRGGRVS